MKTIKALSKCVLWLCWVWEPSTRSADATLGLTSLQVENKVAPLGIDVSPRFSWVVTSSQRGVSQTSYQILVSKVKPGNSDIWDSGVVISDRPYLIEYDGPALSSNTLYFWSVNIAASTEETATASSNFTTGFLSASDWNPSIWIGKPNDDRAISTNIISAFRSASWIWTSEDGAPDAPPDDRAFRKTYSAPSGKTAVSATILLTVDDQFTLFVNGQPIGSSPNTTDVWKVSQVFHVPLSSGSNVFAIRGINLPDVNTGGVSPAGVLAAIEITLSDGSSTVITSDTTWRSFKGVPSDFQSLSFDDSQWPAAAGLAAYGSGPWGTQVTIPSPTPELSFTNSTWIWSSETSPPSAPAQPRAFRKTMVAPSGKTLKSAVIIITADDGFDLYLNGDRVGSSPNQLDIWKSAQMFTVNLAGPSALVAVRAVNLADRGNGGDSPAGLLAAIQVTFSDGSLDTVVSDTSWKVIKTVPAGFEQPSTDDSSWSFAASLGKFGVGPWGTSVTISDSLAEHPAPLLRKEFSISKSIALARLYYSAGGYASISINGAPASDCVLTPGFTKYDTEVQYISVDVSSKLRQGTNAVGVELGRSHYGVTQGNVWNWNNAPWRAEPALRMVLSIVFTDGTTTKVVSDSSWQVKEGPTRLDDVFGGENFDARLLQPGFDQPGFVPTGWINAQVVAGPRGALVNQGQPPTRIIQTLTPVTITQPVQGIYVAAFERNVAGWARITATGPEGSLITIHYGEKLKNDGTVMFEDTNHYYANNFQTDRFWLSGTGSSESFEAKFSYKGYQYVQVEGWPGSSPPTASNIIGRVVHDDLYPRGSFDSSNDLLNKMHKAALFTMLNNVHSIPEDCPMFEKNGWSGDAMLGAEMFLMNFAAEELLAKYVRDLDESRPNGSGPPGVIAPDSGWGANNQAPTWHSAFVFIPWWIYYYRGDARILQTHYDSMKNYVLFELNRSPNNIASTSLGDWVSPETSPDGGNAPEDLHVSATAYLYQMLATMSNIATVLGKSDDAKTFGTQASNVKSAFNKAFFNVSTGFYAGSGDNGYRQTHNLLALAFGLAPNATSAQGVADSVAKDVIARGNHLNTGALGTKYVLPMLSDYGHADTAFAVSQQTTFPSWGFWIVNSANTMWEHWAIEARSHDHLFLGTFEDWLYKHVAGIQATSAAFRTVTIKPLLTSHFDAIHAWTMTPFGNLTVEWSRNGSSVNLNVDVPVGVNATISVRTATELAEKNPAAGQGIKAKADDSASGIEVKIGSGSYTFAIVL